MQVGLSGGLIEMSFATHRVVQLVTNHTYAVQSYHLLHFHLMWWRHQGPNILPSLSPICCVVAHLALLQLLLHIFSWDWGLWELWRLSKPRHGHHRQLQVYAATHQGRWMDWLQWLPASSSSHPQTNMVDDQFDSCMDHWLAHTVSSCIEHLKPDQWSILQY